MSAESKVAAPVGGVDVLAEVLALMAKATPGEWQHDRYAPCNEGRTDDPDLSLWADMGEADEQFIANIAFDITRPDDCDAICAAVNYLRSHGPAVAELVAAVADVYGNEDSESCDPGCPSCRIRAALLPFQSEATDMTTKDTGGSSFPTFSAISHCDEGGMTLRDWFAGKAMQGYFAAPCTPHQSAATNEVAAYCYAMADAMLAARKEES